MKKTCWICICGMIIAALLPVSWQMILKDSTDESSAHSFTSDIKRHSEGTFTSDFTEHLDNMKARDFVHWLINAKRYSSTKRFIKEKPIFLGYPPGSFWLRSLQACARPPRDSPTYKPPHDPFNNCFRERRDEVIKQGNHMAISLNDCHDSRS
ncbi:pro-glucagon-like [Pituophis catenifer annectens]|uniref:pro-glucagon-like n=1 Tax=Pituophis catenifer annectens TaxID=94852 RepID=UPI00399373D8